VPEKQILDLFIFAGKKVQDGKITAGAIDVGRNGVAPPM
jgi:hypothetical protein